MSASQNIPCAWRGCDQKFGSEIDMNMHTLMNHMILLQHGTFTLNRQENKRKRTLEEDPIEIVKRPVDRQIADQIAEVKTEPIDSYVTAPPEKFEPPEDGPESIDNILDTLSQPIEQNIPESPQWMNDPNVEIDDGGNEDSRQSGSDQQEDTPNYTSKLSDVINDFIQRLRSMKRVGFKRPDRTVYCIVCLKYVKSYQECNWKHSLDEEKIAERWFRRFGNGKPKGKFQLLREFAIMKEWMLAEENGLQ
uniref:C2H2-type domain-containing protein n=1 Tax=Caenorhabditis tropicalis TaxID=1561998 RepID=A0A1I7TVZ3_9PELO